MLYLKTVMRPRLFFLCFALMILTSVEGMPCPNAVARLMGGHALTLFENLAKKQGVGQKVLGHAAFVSFIFKHIEAKAWEMQATPVTQLQWALVMGDNPSHFVKKGKRVSLSGREVLVDFNLPVENVSWEEVQQFLQRLNQFQDEYTYSLPSNKEWEFAARGENRHPLPVWRQ